jgi:hypothetical protein
MFFNEVIFYEVSVFPKFEINCLNHNIVTWLKAYFKIWLEVDLSYENNVKILRNFFLIFNQILLLFAGEQ